MISKEIVKYSLNNLSKRKSRSLLTILSIFIGITAIFIFISFGMGLYNYINSLLGSGTADKVLIQAKGAGATGSSSFGLNDSDLKAIQQTNGVKDATGYYTKVAQIESGNTVRYGFAVGYNPQKGNLIKETTGLKIGEGRELQKGDTSEVVLGYDYELNNKVFPKGLSVNDQIDIQGQKLKVVGFYQEVGDIQDDTNIYMTDTLFKQIFPNSTKYYYMIIARVDTGNITKVVNNIDKSLLSERGLKPGQEFFTIQSFNDLIKSYSSALNIVIGFIILIALISVLVSAINTSNTMITSVLERVKEIGVIKSIGARNSEVLSLFLFESGALGLVAGIIGVVLGFGITEIAGKILKSLGLGFLQPGYSIWLFAGCILFATLTGAVSGFIPAIKASRTNPTEALRYE